MKNIRACHAFLNAGSNLQVLEKPQRAPLFTKHQNLLSSLARATQMEHFFQICGTPNSTIGLLNPGAYIAVSLFLFI